jgi:hypothetical protein
MNCSTFLTTLAVIASLTVLMGFDIEVNKEAMPASLAHHDETTAVADAAAPDDGASGQTMASVGFDLSWHTIDSGGGTSAGPGGFSLSGTLGQPDAGFMSNEQFELAGGFWAGGAGEASCPNPADINCDGVVDGSDLLILLSAWGECPNPDNCPADLNNDGVVDGSDLLILLSSWG